MLMKKKMSKKFTEIKLSIWKRMSDINLALSLDQIELKLIKIQLIKWKTNN